MRKRVLSVFMCLCMVLTMCPSGFAEATEELCEEILEEENLVEADMQKAAAFLPNAGKIGDTLSWTLAEDGVLTVSGTGEIPDFADGTAPWASRSEEILSVMIGEDVTGIGSYAFSGCSQMDTLWMGASVQRIGEGAFRNCAALTEITLPEGMTRIEGNTFENCAGLLEISIPAGVSGIGSAAFAGCRGLTEVVLPPDVTVLENNTFQGCTGLSQVSFPPNLTKIGDCVFEDCRKLREVTLPETVKTIGAAAFQNCVALEKITLPENLFSMGSGAFRNCNSLGEIALPGEVTQIPNGAFEDCAALSRVVFPDALEAIGSSAFKACGKLTQVTIPDHVTQIGTSAFYGCAMLERVTLPEGLEKIEEMLFSGCGSLQELTLPETVISIGYQAFYNCPKLKMEAFPKGLQSIGEAAFGGCGDLHVIDLSGLPQTVDREIDLSGMAVFPEALSGAAASWSIETVPGQQAGRRIGTIVQENGSVFLKPLSSGRLRLVCWERTTGIRNSREIQVLVGLEIRPAEETEIVSGEKIQLILAESSGGKEWKAVWSLEGENAQSAEITQDGLFTAKPVEKRTQVTVRATASTGETVEKTITILPRATGVELLLNGEPVGNRLRVDMAEGNTFRFSVKVQPEDALTTVQWGTDDERIAYVEDGTVTLWKPGTVTLLAACTDGSNTVGKTELQVYYIDAAPVLTLTSDNRTLNPGETARLQLAGEKAIAPEKVLFSVSDAEKATVDADGKLTAGDTPGTVTVTAQLKEDPLLRVAQADLEILEGGIKKIRLVPVFPDDRGYLTEKICVEAGKLAGKAYIFRLNAQGSAGGDRWQELTEVSYGSSDPALAQIASDGTVTVLAKKEGSCLLTARTQNGLETQIELQVLDGAPRLENSKLTMNSYQTQPISTGLVEIYGNTIEWVSLHDYDASAKIYQIEPSQSFAAAYEDGMLRLEALGTRKNGTYPLKLMVGTANTTFDYQLQIKVANALPKVNVKQTEKFELFYLDSQAGLSVSAPGNEIDWVALIGTEDFRLEEAENGWELCYGENFLPGAKANTKGTLQIFLEGFRVPVEKALSIAATNTVPKLTMDPASGVVNPAQESISVCRVFRGGQILDLTDAEIEADSGIAEVTARGEELRFTLTGTKGGTVNMTLRLPNWTKAVKLSRKITVENKLPSVKLRSGTLKLNRRFPWQTAETSTYLTQNNQTLGTMSFQPAAKEGTALRTEAEKLRLSMDPDGTIRVSFKDAANLPKNGSYSFACRGELADGTALSAVNLKVTVADTAPKVKFSTGSVRMNRYLAGKGKAEITVTVSDPAYRVVGFRELENDGELSYAEGILTVCLTEGSQNRSYLLTPVVEDVENRQTATLSNALKLGLTVYDSAKLGVTLSAKGKLDTLVPESAISYTVTKLANCQGRIEDMTLEGPDADRFRAELDTTGTKPVVKLRLLEEETYDTRAAYQLQFRFTVCGEEVLSPVQKVRVNQSALKVTVPKTLNLYLGQKAPLRCSLVPSAPIETIALSYKTDKTFLEALAVADNVEVKGNQVLFHMAAPEKLKAGKSYSVYLDLTPVHNASNVKPTQVKLTVKAVK